MLGPFGSQIMRILNILTPSEIDRYIDQPGQEGVKATEGMSDEYPSLDNRAGQPHYDKMETQEDEVEEIEEEESSGAKIIPLHAEHAELVEEQIAESVPQSKMNNVQVQAKKVANGYSVNSNSGLESIGVMSAASIHQLKQDEMKQERSKKDSSSVFILKNRKKLEESQNKLKEQAALKTYQTQGAVELVKVDLDAEEEDLKVGETTGILIDKEQY